MPGAGQLALARESSAEQIMGRRLPAQAFSLTGEPGLRVSGEDPECGLHSHDASAYIIRCG
jgi:hypothetical protein